MVLVALGAIAGLWAIVEMYSTSKQNEIVQSSVKEMEAEVARLKGEGEKVQQQLSPQQRDLLIASHKLVANKTFGWSRLFSDLEDVLPGNVSASRIAVENVYRDGDSVKADLELGVISTSPEAVIAMIGTMNNSGLFQAELRSQSLQKNERLTYTEYTLRLIYTPSYGYSTAQADQVAQIPSGGGAQ